VEPLHLQLVCSGLWEKLPHDTAIVTRDFLTKTVDVDQALSAFYSQAVATAAGRIVSEGKLRRWVQEQLITPAGTRSIVYLGTNHTVDIPSRSIRALSRAQIIRAEFRAGALWYELTHDRFVGPIQNSNRSWRNARMHRATRRVLTAVTVLVFLVGMVKLVQGVMVRDAKQIVEASQRFEFLQLYRNPNAFSEHDLADKFWLSAADGGKAILSVKTSLERLQQRGWRYGPESYVKSFTFGQADIDLVRGRAEITTKEEWFLPMLDSAGIRVADRKPELGPLSLQYDLKRKNGRWLIVSSTTPYAKK